MTVSWVPSGFTGAGKQTGQAGREKGRRLDGKWSHKGPGRLFWSSSLNIGTILGGPQAACKNLDINETKEPFGESVTPCVSILLLL